MFNFRQAQQPQVIDPRASYEQQSILADQMAQMAQQYTPNSGGLGALAMMLNAYGARKMGDRAQGSLSAALEQENERAQKALMAEQDAERKRSERALQDAMALNKQRFELENQNRLTPEQEMQNRVELERQLLGVRQEFEQPQQGVQLPPLVQAGMQRADQLLEAGTITPEQHTNITNNLLNVDTADPNAPPEPSADERKREQARTDVANSLANYRQLLERHGTEYAGDDAAALEAAYYDVILKVKTAEDLGVIAGPDMGLMEGVVGANPTGLFAQVNPMGASRRLARIDQYMKNNNLVQGSDIVDPFAGGQ